MSDIECPSFSNKDEEIRYWKKTAKEFKHKLKESHQELEEYQSHSSELEAELETELEQKDARCSELRHQVAKLASENEELKERLTSQNASLESRVDTLEEELEEVRAIKNGLTNYIRQLEQANDDLERAKRATLTSLEDFEARLNQAIERNAFLESELDEKENLKEMVQRLKDESRDLRQEVIVRQQQIKINDAGDCMRPRLDNDTTAAAVVDGVKFTTAEGKKSGESRPVPPADLMIDSNKLADEASGTKGDRGTPLTPSARISALNIVGDLLRKVGALETRLASCRVLVKDNQRPVTTSNSSAR